MKNHFQSISGRIFVTLFFSLSIPIFLHAQVKRRDDIIWNDSVQLIGKIRNHGPTWVSFSRSLSDSVTVYRPNQIEGFQVDGMKYGTLNINGNQEFYRMWVEAKISLYSQPNGYAWRRYDSIYTFSKSTYRKAAKEVFNCKAISRIKYSKASLVSWSKQFEAKTCQIGYVNNYKLGFMIGYARLSIDRNFELLTINSIRLSISGNLFFEYPIGLARPLFGTLELVYLVGHGTYSSEENSVTRFLTSKSHLISLPIGAKLILPVWNRVFPYMRLGLSYSRLTDVATDSYFEITYDGTNYYTTDTQIENVNSSSVGYFVGTGVEIATFKSQLMHLDLRYSNSSTFNNGLLESNYFSINIGYSF